MDDPASPWLSPEAILLSEATATASAQTPSTQTHTHHQSQIQSGFERLADASLRSVAEQQFFSVDDIGMLFSNERDEDDDEDEDDVEIVGEPTVPNQFQSSRVLRPPPVHTANDFVATRTSTSAPPQRYTPTQPSSNIDTRLLLNDIMNLTASAQPPHARYNMSPPSAMGSTSVPSIGATSLDNANNGEWVCPTNIFPSDDSDEEDIARTAMLLTSHRRRRQSSDHLSEPDSSDNEESYPFASISSTDQHRTHRMATRSSTAQSRARATANATSGTNSYRTTEMTTTTPSLSQSEPKKRAALKSEKPASSSTKKRKKDDCIGIGSDEEKAEPEEHQKCCICLEVPTPEDRAKLDSCSHTYCFSCIETWSERENSCPQCKARFTKIERMNPIPSSKKRKGGKSERPQNVKRVKRRDQSSDFMQPFHHLFAGMDNVHNMPQFAQLILNGLNGPPRASWEPARPTTLMDIISNRTATEGAQSSALRPPAERLDLGVPRRTSQSSRTSGENQARSANFSRNFDIQRPRIMTSIGMDAVERQRRVDQIIRNVTNRRALERQNRLSEDVRHRNTENFESGSGLLYRPNTFGSDLLRDLSRNLQQSGEISFATNTSDVARGRSLQTASGTRADSPHPFNREASTTFRNTNATMGFPSPNMNNGAPTRERLQNNNAGRSADDPLEILDSDDESCDDVVEVVVVN